jgi:hypothetical protein
MSKSKSDSGGADLSDYKFWRSQHRPVGDEAGAEQPAKVDVFADAVANRLGEETGQSLHALIWPQVPEKWKNLVSILGGRIAPMVSASMGAVKGARKVADKVAEKRSLSRRLFNQLEVEIDGKKVTPDWGNTGDLFEQLCSAKLFWSVRAQTDPSWLAILPSGSSTPVMKFDVGDTSEASGGVLQVDDTSVEAAGVKLESGSQQRHLLALQRFELLKQFLIDLFTRQFYNEHFISKDLDDLKAFDVDLSNDDWMAFFSQLDAETKQRIVFAALALQWRKLVVAAL